MSAARRILVCSIVVAALAGGSSAQAVHLYRGPGGGCTPADGALGAGGTAGATIQVLHNSFNDAATALPVTIVTAGQKVKWTWNSVHCHSIKAAGGQFYSGFFYPAPTPSSPQGIPGVFDYPVLEEAPTLSFTASFATPGIYPYFCEHHQAIGMNGVIVVV